MLAGDLLFFTPCYIMRACMLSQLSRIHLFVNPMDCSPPGSSVHGIFQAIILEWIAISFFRDLPDPGIELTSLMSPALASGFIITSTTKEALSGKPSGESLGSDIIGHN